MNNKILVVFNTCGISGHERVDAYINSINSLLNQKFDDYRVVISSCCNSLEVRQTLYNTFGRQISYNFIDHVMPVTCSFNLTVKKSIEKLGAFRAYLYVDSGCYFEDNLTLQKLYDLHIAKNCGMTAARTENDSGVHLWYGIGKHDGDESGQDKLFRDGDFRIPIEEGKTTNLHIQLFDHSIIENFGHLYTDILASFCSESIFPAINSAIHKNFYICRDTWVRHNISMDGASSGFRPERNKFPAWQHTFLLKSPDYMLDLIPKIKEMGIAYEACQSIVLPNPEKFDENGFYKEPEKLIPFIKKSFYLPASIFDYDKIPVKFLE